MLRLPESVQSLRGRTTTEYADTYNCSPTADCKQLIFFLAPSRTLAEQQFKALNSELSAYGIRLLTGADGVEKWTDQRLWDAVLTNVKVVVATPAVLKDALSHAFVTISRVALCVFDEGQSLSNCITICSR